MPRIKVIHAWINDDSQRRTAFKKRHNGLLKKVSEISTLCDVEACAIIYGPYDAEPEIYPNLPEATKILQAFKELPEIEQYRKMLTQEAFLKEKLVKSLQQCQKLENQIQAIHRRTILYEFMSGDDMNELDAQEARIVYQTAGLMEKFGYEWMKTLMEKGGNSSEDVMRVPALTNEDFHLDDAIASSIKELMMQDQNQIVPSNFNHPNQQSVSNVNQQLMIQHPLINYHVNDQMMHQQAGMRANVFQPMASIVQTNDSNMQTGHQELANMDEAHWNDLELFGSL